MKGSYIHPVFDLAIIGGGLSLCVGAIALAGLGVPPGMSTVLSASLPTVAFLMNLSHFASSTVRLYSKPRALDQHGFLTLGLPIATFVVLGMAVAFAERVGHHLTNLYLTWSPYHYSAQAYGLAVMYCYRSQVPLALNDRRWLRAACFAPFVYAFLKGPGAGIEWFLPWWVLADATFAATRALLLTLATTAAALLPVVLYLRTRRNRMPLPAISLLVIVSNAFWWLLLLDTAFAIVAVAHGVQYLAIVTIFHVKERLARPQNRHGWFVHAASFYGATVVLAYLLFNAWPYAFVFAGFGPVESLMLVVATINIHHFVVDGYIWRFRQDPGYKALVQPEAPALSPAIA